MIETILPRTREPSGYFSSMPFHGCSRKLLETEGNAFLVFVEIEHFDLEPVAERHDLGRMVDAAPRHIGDMQEPVHAAKVDERAEVGDVLDRSFAYLPFFEFGEDLFAQGKTVLFEDHAAGNHDVPADLVHLDDAEFEGLADDRVHVGDLAQIDLRTREERVDAEEIDHHAALDPAMHPAFDGLLLFENVENPVPNLEEIGAGFGKNDLPLAVFDLFEENVDLVAGFEILDILEFVNRNDAFRLEIDIDDHFLVG